MTEENIPPIIARLAVDRVDTNFFQHQEVKMGFYTPGEEVSTQGDFLRYFWIIFRDLNFIIQILKKNKIYFSFGK